MNDKMYYIFIRDVPMSFFFFPYPDPSPVIFSIWYLSSTNLFLDDTAALRKQSTCIQAAA